MIILEEGSEKYPPWVKVELTTGIWPSQWWFEVMHWDKWDRIWVHDYEKDGGAFGIFGFWRAWTKAKIALSDQEMELFEEDEKNKKKNKEK